MDLVVLCGSVRFDAVLLQDCLHHPSPATPALIFVFASMLFVLQCLAAAAARLSMAWTLKWTPPHYTCHPSLAALANVGWAGSRRSGHGDLKLCLQLLQSISYFNWYQHADGLQDIGWLMGLIRLPLMESSFTCWIPIDFDRKMT